jgi:hypothetical protein
MLSSILSLLGDGLLGKVGDLAKIFVGSKSERDQAIATEMAAIQEAYKAELLAPERIGYWAAFVDGLNRLVRPSFTFGIVALFVWAALDAVGFTVTMTALAAVPDMLWYIFLTIIAFWFGGRIIEKAPMRIKALDVKQLATVIAAKKALENIGEPVTLPPDAVNNAVIDAPDAEIEKQVVSSPEPKKPTKKSTQQRGFQHDK